MCIILQIMKPMLRKIDSLEATLLRLELGVEFKSLEFYTTFLKKIIYLINLFLAALDLRCCTRAFSSCSFSLRWLLLLRSMGSIGAWALVVVARGLQSTGSVVVAHGLSCSAACGIFPDQRSNPCPLY